MASPNVGTHNNLLSGVTAVAANDVWAVGNFLDSTSNPQALIEHWNGTKWRVVASPKLGLGASALNAVKAVSANNVWAVGEASPQPLIEHWNEWREVE